MPTPHRGRPAGSRKAPRSRGSMPNLEVITMGRVGVDLYPEQIGVTLAEVRTFAKSLGGSPTNVAVAAARLGRRAAVITKVGDDGFGVYVRRALAEFGVDARWVGTDAALPTPLVFCEIFPPDRFPVYFYREPKAPDMNIAREELDLSAIAAAPVFWTTGTGLSDEPSRTATLAALDARQRRDFTIHDLDHRHHLWHEGDDARRWAREAAKRATVVLGNIEELEMATGTRNPVAGAAALSSDSSPACGASSDTAMSRGSERRSSSRRACSRTTWRGTSSRWSTARSGTRARRIASRPSPARRRSVRARRT